MLWRIPPWGLTYQLECKPHSSGQHGAWALSFLEKKDAAGEVEAFGEGCLLN